MPIMKSENSITKLLRSIYNFIAQKIESIKKTHSQMHILVQTGTCTHNLSFKIIITKKDKQLHVHVIQL